MKRWICRGLLFAGGLVLSILMASLATTGLRESKTPAEAAPASGKFIQTRDARLYVRQDGPVDGRHNLLIHFRVNSRPTQDAEIPTDNVP